MVAGGSRVMWGYGIRGNVILRDEFVWMFNIGACVVDVYCGVQVSVVLSCIDIILPIIINYWVPDAVLDVFRDGCCV